MSIDQRTPQFSIYSVIKNVVGREAMFRRSIESVLHQTFTDFEYVIQDGGSIDGTADIVAQYADPRIRFLSEEDSCGEEGFFRVLKRCRGRYIGSCLSDEELFPDALEQASRVFVAHPHIAAFYGNVSYVDENANKSGPRVPPHPFSIEAYVCQTLVPPFCSSFFHRESLERAGLHEHPWRYEIGEFEFWIRLANVGTILYQPVSISHFGRHSQSHTRCGEIYDALLAARERVMPALFRENEILRDCKVTVEQAIAGNYAWAADSVFKFEGPSERWEYFVRQAERYDPNAARLPKLRSKARKAVSSVGQGVAPSPWSRCAGEAPSTPEELKDLIRRECPGLDEALRCADVHRAVDILRDWTSRTVAVTDETKKIHPTDVVSAYRIFSGRHGGVWCGGTAVFHAMVLNLFGIPATHFGYADSSGSVLSHAVTLFADVKSESPRFYISDAYFNLDYRDAVSNRPLDLPELLRRIGYHQYDSIRMRERPAVRPCVVAVGVDVTGYWYYRDGRPAAPQREPDRWIYADARLTLASLVHGEPTWQRQIEERRGHLQPDEFVFQLMRRNHRFGPFVQKELTRALTEQLDSCANAPLPGSVQDMAHFSRWIETLTSRQNRLYHRDQSSETLAALASQARAFDPTVIVELGTLAGLSLRTWITSAPRAKIYAVDRSFAELHETMRLLPVDLSRVTLLEQDILDTDFTTLWTPQDKVIFFVDAHDLPGVPIMEHVLTKALPVLPDGSLVIVDDVWFSEERLTRDNAQTFLNSRVVGEIDELQCFEGHYAPYHKGGSFMGFAEVIPLLDFVNRHGIELHYDEDAKHVHLIWRKGCLSRCCQPAERPDEWGTVLYHPLACIPASASLGDAMQRILRYYKQNRIAEAAQALVDLMDKHPGDWGFAYGLAVCFARCGQLRQARDILGRVVPNSDNPSCRRLFEDLVARVGPGGEAQTPRPQPQNERGLTIFAMPKAFVGHVAVIQKNAIRSWARLDPAPEIILFGDEQGIREMAEEVGACHVPHIERNEFGTPLVNKLFEAAQLHASHAVLAYVNADMILFQDFADGVQRVRTQQSQFLLIGQRWDIPVLEEIDFRQPCWQRSLQEQMAENAMLHAECGLDYFVFPKGLYREIPPFAIGRTAWDNWLVMAPHTYGAVVVDGTEFITAVHQDHDYGHVAGGREEAWKGVEAARNRELAGASDNTGRTSGATWILNRQGVLVETPPRQPNHLTAAYRAARVDWLLRQADRLMAAGRRDLAACKQEESLGHQEVLIAAKQSSRASSDSVGSTRLIERYATTCVCLAQCQAQMGQYERAVASYSRLLENRRLSIPETLREKLVQQRDACARRIRPDRASATSSASLLCRDAAACVETRPDGNRSVDVAAGRPAGSRPKVTVIAACHDAERHLAECLDSILCQTLAEWELFLLDDGSTDGTRRIMADYAARDARIRAFYFDDNAGPYVRRNFAIEKAGAPLIVIQDADDIMVPQKLERLHLAITQDERLAVVGSFYHMFLNEYEGAEHCEAVALETTHEQILAEYRSSATCDFCWHGSAIIRKRVFDEIGPYDENPFASDSFWLAKVAEYACRNDKIRLMNIPEVLTLRRMHVGSQTGSLPAFDPRSRRARFKEFRARRLSEVIRQLDFDPQADVRRLLRQTVCSDFARENGHRFAEWESAPLTPRMVREFIGRICSHLTNSQFVRCIVTSQIVEQLVEGIAQNVRSYDLVKALAYFALGYPQQAEECLDREWRTHGTPLAAFFRAKYVDRYDGWWTRAERMRFIEQAIFLGDSDEPSEPARCLLERGVKGPKGLSVVVSVADGGMPWTEMIASFNAQTEKDFEVIALTRGPVPGDLASVADSVGFRLVVLGVGQGAGWGRHRNAAAKQAEGRYVAFLGPHVLPDGDFVRCILQHVRRQDLSGLRGRIACTADAVCPVRFDLGPAVLDAACDIDEMCVFERATFLRFGGFGGMPFDHGAIQLSCRIYADPDASRRPILYCPDVLVHYSGPVEPHAEYVDSLIVEHRFAIGQLMQSNCLAKEQESDAWSFLVFVTGLCPSGTWTDDERHEQCLQNSLFFRKRNPRVAIEWAQKALQGRPDSIKAKCVLGSSWTLLGRPAEACTYLEGILAPLEELLGRERLDRVQKEFHDYRDITECYIAACTRLAECYMQIGRYDGVAETYARLLANRHIRLEPAQRQRMEQMRDRLPPSETQSTEGDPSPGGRLAPEGTDSDHDTDRTSPPTAIEMPADRATDEDEALDERTAQVLVELERKYRSMPRGASGKHAVAVKLAELFRKAGRKSKARALDFEARTLSNALAFAQARRDKPAVCSHRPTIVEFNVITRCNGGCVMCGYGMDGEIVDLEQFRRLADEWLPTAMDVHLIGGEVLLHPQFYDLCEYANRFGVSLGMTTNLSTLAGRRAETIRKFFNTVRVSVDGSTRQTYESIRTRLRFDRLCRNLEILADIRRDKPDLGCELAFVAMRQNIAELPDVIEMAGRYAFDSVAVNFVHIYSASALDDSLLFHREQANESFDLARAKAARLGLVLDIPNNFDVSRPPYVASQQLTEGHRRCVRPWQRVRILLNGDVVPCCHLLDLPMGNALTEPLEGVWNGRKLQDLRQAIKDSRDDMPHRCKHCQILMGGTDSNDVMVHVGPALVPEMRERLGTPSRPASSASTPASRPSGPRVTVVTTCRNAQTHLAECLDGILSQTLTEWELFLIDDGSTDDTRRIIETYAARDARIRPLYFDDSAGPYVRRNFAIRQARAPFISIQDADDIMVPQKLERLVEAIAEDQRLGVVGSFYRSFLDEFTGIEHTEAAILPTTQEQMLEVYRTQRIWDYLWHGSAIVRRDLFDTIGLYDENPFGADSFWLAKAIEYAHHTGRVRLGTIPEFLTLRRVHADSQTGLLPTMDPRSRRVAYAQYCLETLEGAVGRAECDSGVDMAHELRECTCSDFLERRGDQAIEGEKQPADDRAMDDLLRRALEHLRERRYVSCVRTLRWLEIMDPAVAVRAANFDLIHAMALYGLGHTNCGRDCLHREMVNHDNSMARQLHQEIFERGVAVDVAQWYAERADVITPRIDRVLWPKASPKAHLAAATTPAGSPKVTVVTACRNAERFLAECVDSILAQTLGEWELFLLDDGSTDDSRQIMAEYARHDGRIQVHRFDDSRGPYVRRNFAIERAAADFIVVHDADDIMCPTKLETLYHEIRMDDRMAMVGSDYRTFLDRYRGPQCSEHNRLPRTNEEILARFRSWQHGMSHGSAIIRKSLFAEIGLYDENPFAADSFWSAKLALYAEAGKPVCAKSVPECLTLIRMHGSNSTRLVSTLDPRNRRMRYRQYCMVKLQGVRDRLRLHPGADIGRELRQCTCGDFLTRFKAQIIAWENEPLDEHVVPEYLRLAVDLFNGGCYVSCAGMLNDVEALAPTVMDRVEGFDLLRGLALFALRMEPEARLYLEREIDRHDHPAARQFVRDAFESARPVDVVAWCREHDGRLPIGLAEARPKASPTKAHSVGAA